jgi:o-succinylbenzoate---CoA ligase
MRQLVALAMPGGPGFVNALQRIWDEGDAVFPIDLRLPPPARERVLQAMAPSAVVDEVGERASFPNGRPVEDGDALVVATSGSTGDPKGVVLTHAAVRASAQATTGWIGRDPNDHWMACLPLAHVGGLSVVTRALAMGIPLTVLPSVDSDEIRGSKATLISLVPAALRRVDVQQFRRIVLGGSRPPEDRPANSVATYGMTETGSGIVYDGFALDGVELRIVDGHIEVRGPMLLRCYRDGQDPKSADGWLPTGDLGSLADDGRLSVFGRAGDLIITGGENVWPEAVEAVLNRHHNVADVAVTGLPDPTWGQAVTAVVVPRAPTSPPTLDELRDCVKAELPAFCAPHRLALVDAIPRTALGKIRRSEVLAIVI